MPKPSRGEVWQTDMGIAGKVRPCLLLTDYPRKGVESLWLRVERLKSHDLPVRTQSPRG